MISANFDSYANLDEFLQQHLDRELLRFTTAGSVDDGKSTLIGRLLHDSKSVYEDQLASIKKSRVNRSSGPIDFSLLTDGLRAEREQGITIDVAYRYFSTSRRKFIIADTPGHEQYTRNMATGASGAHLAIVLIDGSKGLLPQSRRHTYIASLLGIPHLVAAINKMDLVDYDEKKFGAIRAEFLDLAAQLGIRNAECIPISALEGDNVVTGSEHMHWYKGPTLLEHLETVPIPAESTGEHLRFPVQYVVRPDRKFRGFAGQVASGVLHPGDKVLALPSGQKTRIKSIVTYDGELPEAYHPMSVTLQLEDEIDLSRGEMLVTPEQPPHVSHRFEAMIVWMNATPMRPGQVYVAKHTSRQLRAKAVAIRYGVDVNNMTRVSMQRLAMNDIACVEFETSSPFFFDLYRSNRTTGSFILMDPVSNATVGAGMIENDLEPTSVSFENQPAQVEFASSRVAAEERYARQGHFPALIHADAALTGKIERALFDSGFRVVSLDDVSIESITHALPVLERAGVIAVMSGAASGELELIRQCSPTESYLNLHEIGSDADAGTVIREALVFAEGLRIHKPAPTPEVN